MAAGDTDRRTDRDREQGIDRVTGGDRVAGGDRVTGGGRRFGILAAAAVLLLCGMLFGASLWVVASFAAGAMIAGNFALAAAWSGAAVAVRTGGDREVKVGSRVAVEVAVTNRGRLPIAWLLAEDLMPRWAVTSRHPSLRTEGERLRVMMLMPGQTRRLRYEVICHRRGYFQIGPTVLETGDLMGLFRRYRVGAAPQFVTVLPEVGWLSGYDVGSRRPIGEIRIRDSVIEDPTRLRGIRLWQPGDPMRSVHWAATARTGSLHTKVYEPSSLAGVTLVPDLHESTNPARHEPVRGDLAVSAAATIAAAIHEMNEPLGLATNGRDAAERVRTEGWIGDHRVRDELTRAVSMADRDGRLRPLIVPAARGTAHLKQITRTLGRLDRTDGLTLPECLAECEGRIARETTLMVILQQCPPESLASLLSLSRRGWAVEVIINTHEVEDYARIAGPLIADNIATHHLRDRESITALCRAAMPR